MSNAFRSSKVSNNSDGNTNGDSSGMKQKNTSTRAASPNGIRVPPGHTARARAKARRNKVPGVFNWTAFTQRHRKELEAFVFTRHYGAAHPDSMRGDA